MRFVFLIALTIFHFKLTAQTKAKVTFTQNSKITELVNRRVEESRNAMTTDGYRVQLHFGNDRDKARDIKSKFLNSYQTIPAYDSYQQPNFRVRVGDFRTRIEATKFLKQIKAEFPSAFVVTDEIKFPKLLDEK